MDRVVRDLDHFTAGIAQSVGRAIEDAEISIRKVAAATGIPYATLHRKINGQGRTGFLLTELLAIAEVLDLKLSQLLPADLVS